MENKIVTIKPLKKNALGQMSRIPTSTYTFSARLTRNGYLTGLTAKEEKELEKELRLEEGTLSNRSSYWKEYSFKFVGDREVELDLTLPQNYLDYKLLSATPEVAPNEESVNALAHDFVIIDTEQKANKELVRIKQHNNAVLQYTKMSVKDMRDALKLLGYKTTNMSENLVQTTLSKEIDDNPTKFNQVIDDPDYNDKVFIKDLETNSILSKNGTKYYFGDINNVLGNTIEEVVDYLKDKTNNEVKIQLKKALQREQSK